MYVCGGVQVNYDVHSMCGVYVYMGAARRHGTTVSVHYTNQPPARSDQLTNHRPY